MLKFCKKSKASDYYPPSRHSFVCNLFVFYLLKRIRAELYLQFFSLFFFCLSLFFWRSFALSLSHLSTEKFSGSSCHLKTVKGVKTVPLHHISLTLSYTSSRRMKLIHEHLLQSKIHLAWKLFKRRSSRCTQSSSISLFCQQKNKPWIRVKTYVGT